MVKYIFMNLLCIHALGDFYLQTEKIAQRKKEKFKWVLLHSMIYAFFSFIMISITMPKVQFGNILVFVISHALIDSLKFVVCNYKYIKNKINNINIFIIDQILHIFIIILVAYSIGSNSTDPIFNNKIETFLNVFGISGLVFLSWVIKILLIHKPANILISSMLEKYKPLEEKNDANNEKNAGRFIGTLERIIMTIFITIGQYSAVGLVLTAKSITRYNKISDNPEFAEYYLLGTLLSTIYAICVAILF